MLIAVRWSPGNIGKKRTMRKMNLKPFMIPAVLVVAVWFITACVPASAPSGANCQNGICVDVQLSEPIRFNKPVAVTITVETDQDMPQLGVAFWSGYSVVVEGTSSWGIDTKAHQPVSFTGTVRFTREGYFDVIGHAITREGRRVVDSVPVYISKTGGTMNPTLPSGITPQPTLSPFDSPLPTPPPPTNSSLSLTAGQSVLVTGQNFEDAFPPPGWSVRDLSADGKERYWGKTFLAAVSCWRTFKWRGSG